MDLGFEVPSAYIVPVERFCREMGPALGINLAEFEFPAYFNYFIRSKRCTLLVDSLDAENNIRRVFGQTFLGPEQFRDHDNPKPNEDEDFDPSYPREARPNFYKEFYHFRTAEKATNYEEHSIDTLLEFCHFEGSKQGFGAPTPHEKLGVPPTLSDMLPSKTAHNSTVETNGRRHPRFSEDMPDCASVGHNEMGATLEGEGDCAGSEGEPDDFIAEQPNLRRSHSDPDVRRSSLEDLIPSPIPISQQNETSTADSSGKRGVSRRGSMDSTNTFMTGARSRDGMSWASGASFMLASDDEDDPQRSTWMYSQAKWLGKFADVLS